MCSRKLAAEASKGGKRERPSQGDQVGCSHSDERPTLQLHQEIEGEAFREREDMGVGFPGWPHLQPVVLGVRCANLHCSQLLQRQTLDIEVGHDAPIGHCTRATVVGALHAEGGRSVAQLLAQLAVQPILQAFVLQRHETAGEAQAPVEAHLHLREKGAGIALGSRGRHPGEVAGRGEVGRAPSSPGRRNAAGCGRRAAWGPARRAARGTRAAS